MGARRSGRTALALRILLRAATVDRTASVFVAGAVSCSDVLERILAGRSDISLEALASGRLTDRNWGHLAYSAGRLQTAPLRVVTLGGPDLEAIADAELLVFDDVPVHRVIELADGPAPIVITAEAGNGSTDDCVVALTRSETAGTAAVLPSHHGPTGTADLAWDAARAWWVDVADDQGRSPGIEPLD